MTAGSQAHLFAARGDDTSVYPYSQRDGIPSVPVGSCQWFGLAITASFGERSADKERTARSLFVPAGAQVEFQQRA